MTIALFGVLVGLGVLLRILSISTLVILYDCDGVIHFANGVDGHIGVAVCIMLCAALGGILQLFVARSGLLSGSWTWSDMALGAVNLGVVSVIVAYGSLHLAFANPQTDIGFSINRMSSQHDDVDFYDTGYYELTAYDLDPSYGWSPSTATEAINERAAVLMRYETVKRCWNDDFVRAQFEARFPSEPYHAPGYVNRMDWVHYDLDGRMLTYEQAEDRLNDLRPEYPGRKTAPDGTPLLTYEEILAIVEDEWESNEDLRLPAHSTDDD